MRVFVTGASGYVGRSLVRALVERGDQVVALSRAERKDPKIEWLRGDPAEKDAWTERAAACDAIVHLAGESVSARRWTDSLKKRLVSSRVDAGRLLASLPGPKVFVTASGVDYYPFDDSDRLYAEDAPPGDTFLAKLCVEWEAAAETARTHGARVVALRTGMALGPDSIALAKMSTPFRLFAGGPIGSGRQWIGWIHVDDLASAYLLALDRLDGPVNGVAPEAVHQKDLARELGKALGRPSWLPVPPAAVKLAAGEFAAHVLHGRRVVPTALEKAGFRFRYPELGAALAASV